jgi:hypothetical protein
VPGSTEMCMRFNSKEASRGATRCGGWCGVLTARGRSFRYETFENVWTWRTEYSIWGR